MRPRSQEIASRTQEITALQAEFRDVHRELEAARAELPPLEQVRRDTQRRENERASLTARLARAKEKAGRCVQPVPVWCHVVRLAHQLLC